MRRSEIALPCGARITVEQEGTLGLYAPPWLGLAGPVHCRLDRLPVTLAEVKALVNIGSGRYWGGGMVVRHEYHGGMMVSGIGLTADEATAIANGADPLTVLGVYPARVVLSIVRLPAGG